MFWLTPLFNAPIGRWDVGQANSFSSMFRGALAFNQPLPWDVSSAQNMDLMFEDAPVFNQPIGSWDVRGVSRMNNMFANATSFNQNLCSWGNKVAVTVELKAIFEDSACSQTSLPDLSIRPSGPWCGYCGSPVPTPGSVAPTAAPVTAPPTLTFAPTGPTFRPTSIDRLDLKSGSTTVTMKYCATLLLSLATGYFVVLQA